MENQSTTPTASRRSSTDEETEECPKYEEKMWKNWVAILNQNSNKKIPLESVFNESNFDHPDLQLSRKTYITQGQRQKAVLIHYLADKDVSVLEQIDKDRSDDWRWTLDAVMQGVDPNGTGRCGKSYCGLGCICDSIEFEGQRPRNHCGKPKCFFEICRCRSRDKSLWKNEAPNSFQDDEGYRLRPRVKLLYWAKRGDMSDTAGETRPMNYRELERGLHSFAASSPKQAQVSQPTGGRGRGRGRGGRRGGAVGVSRHGTHAVSAGFRAAAAVVKHYHHHLRPRTQNWSSDLSHEEADEDRRRRIVRRASTGRGRGRGSARGKAPATVASIQENNTEDMEIEDSDCIDGNEGLQNNSSVSSFHKPPTPPISQPTVKVPAVVNAMDKDAQLLWSSDGALFLTWTHKDRNPRVVTYEAAGARDPVVNWLYLPIPPSNTTWILHPLSQGLANVDYVYIPEINVAIAGHWLEVNFNLAKKKNKVMKLDILEFYSQGRIHRDGHIFIFPQLTNYLLCGPFSKQEVDACKKTPKIECAKAVCQFVADQEARKAIGSSRSMKNFKESKRKQIYSNVCRNVVDNQKDTQPFYSGASNGAVATNSGNTLENEQLQRQFFAIQYGEAQNC